MSKPRWVTKAKARSRSAAYSRASVGMMSLDQVGMMSLDQVRAIVYPPTSARPTPTLPEPPPDVSWMREREISDGPPVLAWAMFLVTLVMAAACIALLLA